MSEGVSGEVSGGYVSGGMSWDVSGGFGGASVGCLVSGGCLGMCLGMCRRCVWGLSEGCPGDVMGYV